MLAGLWTAQPINGGPPKHPSRLSDAYIPRHILIARAHTHTFALLFHYFFRVCVCVCACVCARVLSVNTF